MRLGSEAWWVAGAIVTLACASCVSKKGPLGQCAHGICGPVDSGVQAGASGAAGGGAGASGTSGGGSGGSGAGGSGAGSGSGDDGGVAGAAGSAGSGGAGSCKPGASCTEAWLCTPWKTSGSNDNGTRMCTDTCKCGTTNNKPVVTATMPALNVGYYQCNVEPVLDKYCAMLGCHGTETGRALRVYARGRLRITGDSLTVKAADCPNEVVPKATEKCIGSIECSCDTNPHTQKEWRANFDSARGLLLDSKGKARANVEDSELLKQPLVNGGLAHAGVHIFKKNDADYTAIKNWLNKMTATCNSGN